MTDDELQAIEARCDRAWKANAANDRMTWGIFWAAAEDVPALLAEVRRLGMENAALRELDVSRAELGHQNERLRESLAHMTCQTCRFYRFKADSAPGGAPENEIGCCDNPAVHEQLRFPGRVLLSEYLHLDPRDVTEALQWRVRGDFGCKHWEEER